MTWNALIAGVFVRHQGEIALRMTGAARVARHTRAVSSADGRGHVDMLIVALKRIVGRRMTIHAARIHYYFCSFGKERARARLGILNI